MSHHSAPNVAAVEIDPLALAAATWLACGAVLLGLTPLPLHDATLGWSAAFWLLAAPSLVLLAKCALAFQVGHMCERRSGRSSRPAGIQARGRNNASAIPDRQARNRTWRIAA